ncbi:MAG: hypothetical protein K2X07_04175 [Caulobacteraceae bacterium]|nr:hypothetical protein [Caulobacteraceae bacterium]
MTDAPKGLFVPPNRLAKIIDAPGARDFDVLVAQAEQQIDRVRPLVEEGLQQAIAHLIAQCSRPEDQVFSEAHAVALAAGHVVEDAAVVGQMHIAAAAAGVAELMNALFSDGVWHSEAIEVHIAALRLFKAPHPPTPEQIALVLRQLAEARAVIGVKPE